MGDNVELQKLADCDANQVENEAITLQKKHIDTVDLTDNHLEDPKKA